jgi:cyclophilin family peptidyl-prolyl cis-trans isomerase/HEAT repeat protein
MNLRSLSLVLSFLLASSSWGASTYPLDSLSNAEDNRDVSAPVLLQAASSKKKEIRARAAEIFGRIRNSAGLPMLFQLAHDPELNVRKAAAFALGQFGWNASFANGREADIVVALTPLVSERDASLRALAIEAFGKVGLNKTPALVAPSLKDLDPRVRAEALMALNRYHAVIVGRGVTTPLPVLPDDVMNSMLALAQDPHSYVRKNLADFFVSVQDSRGLSAMSAFVGQDPSIFVRLFALNALAKIGDPHGVAPALSLLSHSNYEIRVAALQTLIALKAVDSIPAATASHLIHDPVFHVRTTFAQALGKGIQAQDLNVLTELLGDVSPTVRADSLRSLSLRLTDGALNQIKAALGDPNYGVRVAAVDAAQNMKTGGEAIFQLADLDDDVLVRDEALGALNTVATDSAFATIKRALNSNELSERNSAIYALEGRQEASIPELFFSTYLSSLHDPKWNGLREEVASDLAAIPGQETTGYLQTLAQDPDYLVSSQAETALTARGVSGLPALPKEFLTYSPYRNEVYDRDPIIVFETVKGQIKIQCHAHSARITTASIAGFATDGHYDGLPWHRVVSDFIIQGGDPDKTGYGDAGWDLREEINSWKFKRGSVGIARSSDFDSGGVQIFINTSPTPFLDGQYTVFAQVVGGMDVVDQIEMGDLILRAYVIR